MGHLVSPSFCWLTAGFPEFGRRSRGAAGWEGEACALDRGGDVVGGGPGHTKLPLCLLEPPAVGKAQAASLSLQLILGAT